MGGYVEPKDIDINNPYSVLDVPQNSSFSVCRKAYMNLATNPNRDIRTKACLAYDILCNKQK